MLWGPSTWLFLHSLAETIHPTHYLLVKGQLWNFMKELCSNLPCPDCSNHAIKYISSIPIPATKEEFIKAMFVFHNVVNASKQKPLFLPENLSQYKNKPFVQIFILYKTSLLNQPYNPKLMMHKMRCKKYIIRFQTWLRQQSLI